MALEPSDVLVSVVIPCYNGGAFLAAAIDSALGQSHPRIEVVVVDDGSADGSAALAEGYGERVTLVRQPNTGLSGARNAGIVRSRGEVVVLLDADDVLAPTCVEDRLRLLLSDESVGIVTGSFMPIDAAGVGLSGSTNSPDTIHSREESWGRPLGPPSGWTIRRRVFERCGLFDPLVKIVEDWEFQLRATRHYRVGSCSPLGLYYRQLPDSMSRDYGRIYVGARQAYLKNRAYFRDERWAYAYHGQFGVMCVAETILGRLRELPRRDAVRGASRLILRHPGISLYFTMLALRKVGNAAGRLLGRR